VRKHAKAREVEIRLEDHSGVVHLAICDDGCGFPELSGELPAGATNTYPWSIHERTRALGGRLSVDSKAGQGSRLVVEIPISKAAAAELERLPR
jgi:two-component system sensor histidine kinase DegS